MSEIFDNFFVEVGIQDVYICPCMFCITSFSKKDINVSYDRWIMLCMMRIQLWGKILLGWTTLWI
ncbi:hypothetical protein HanIR_Chr14g0699061 [Helianthus annuus]|nr:hypothetical protein HanIR_Chr14g0699061 [Helianthus annuus]